MVNSKIMKSIWIYLSLIAITSATFYEIEPRITNGKTANQGQFPHQVGIFITKQDDVSFWCGGALIHPEWVLTAAVCVSDLKSATTYLGSIKLADAEAQYQIYPNNVTVHYGYSELSNYHNIALVKIPKTDTSANIKPIALPKTYSDYAYAGVIISGWGVTSNDSDEMAETLQYADLMIEKVSYCRRFYQLPPNVLCLYTLTLPAPCKGDIGGPLILNNETTLIGIGSFGPKTTCTSGVPSVYVDVYLYREWIRCTTKIDI